MKLPGCILWVSFQEEICSEPGSKPAGLRWFTRFSIREGIGMKFRMKAGDNVYCKKGKSRQKQAE